MITLISVAIAGYFAGRYATDSLTNLSDQGVGPASAYATRPLPIRVAFYIHIVFAGVALMVGPFQFAQVIRRRFLAVHRWIGRTYVVSVACASAAALVMACVSSAAVVGFAAPTLRLWLGVLVSVELAFHLVPDDRAFTDAYAVVPFLCWLPNIVVAELLIRRRDLPGLRFSPTAPGPLRGSDGTLPGRRG